MNLNDLMNALRDRSNIENKKYIKLSDKLIKHLHNESDLNGKSMGAFIQEALYNYGDLKYRYNQIDKMQEIANNEVLRLIAKEELKNYMKIFKKKKVEITEKELLDLLVAKLNYEME